MTTATTVVWASIVVAAVNGLAGVYGAAQWYRARPSRAFWAGLRAGQALALGTALAVGVLWLDGRRADDDLFYLYVLLPLAVGFLAEQLRVLAAEQVLAARGLGGRAGGRRARARRSAGGRRGHPAAGDGRDGGGRAGGLLSGVRAAGTAHGFSSAPCQVPCRLAAFGAPAPGVGPVPQRRAAGRR